MKTEKEITDRIDSLKKDYIQYQYELIESSGDTRVILDAILKTFIEIYTLEQVMGIRPW